MVHVHNEHFASRQSISLGPRPAFWTPGSKRFGMALMMCVAIIAETFVKNTLSLSVVCMVNSSALAYQHKDNADFLPGNESANYTYDCQATKTIDKEYDGNLMWSSATQSYLISGLFWGGLVSGLPAGWFADRYSPRILVFICLILSIIGTVFIPLATEVGPWLVFVLRFIAGIGGQAAIYPMVASLCTKWIPPAERSTVIALYTSGIQIASIISFPLNSLLCTTKNFIGGWPAIFYVNSIFIAFCAILWIFIVSNSPSAHKRISEKESRYIHNSLRSQGLRRKSEGMAPTKVPWKSMIKSPAVWVGVINSFLGGTVQVIITVYMPTYFKDVTHVDVDQNGVYTALPFICEWVSKMLFAVIADWMKMKTKISPTLICKVFNTIGMGVPAIFLVLTAFADCNNTALPVVYICLATFFTSGVVPGFFTSLVCIAPQFTGTVNSISRFFGQLSAVLTPLLVGFIIKQGTQAEWKIVFLTVSVFLAVAALVFVIFGSADIQSWAIVKIPDVANAEAHGRHHHPHAGHVEDNDEKREDELEDEKKQNFDEFQNGHIYSIDKPIQEKRRKTKFADEINAEEKPQDEEKQQDDFNLRF